MSFTRHAEIGRVALITYGEDEGKLCTIVDIIDASRALVDGPVRLTGVHRQPMNFKRLALTDFTVDVALGARSKKLRKEWEKAEVLKKWQASSWARRLAARKEKTDKTDLDRFRDMLQKKQLRKRVAAKLA